MSEKGYNEHKLRPELINLCAFLCNLHGHTREFLCRVKEFCCKICHMRAGVLHWGYYNTMERDKR